MFLTVFQHSSTSGQEQTFAIQISIGKITKCYIVIISKQILFVKVILKLTIES